MQPLPTDEDLFYDYVLKDRTFEGLGKWRKVSPSWAFQLVRRYEREHIDRIELELMAARKADQMLMLAVPDQAAQSQALAVRYLDHVTRQLEKRNVATEVHYRAVPDGHVAFFLEDVTNYDERSDR